MSKYTRGPWYLVKNYQENEYRAQEIVISTSSSAVESDSNVHTVLGSSE